MTRPEHTILIPPSHSNLSGPASRETADFLFHFLYNLAEAVLFLDLGFAVFILQGHYNWPLIFITMAACFISRIANIYPISLILNLVQFRCSSKRRNLDQVYTSTLMHSYTHTPLHPYTHTLIHLDTHTLVHSYAHTPILSHSLHIHPIICPMIRIIS
jgi:hypothetical protein